MKLKKKEYLIFKLSDEMKESTKIDAELFKKLDVKRGLRNEDGTGVLVGLTNIGNVVGYDRRADGSLVPIEGKLFFRGYEVRDLVRAFIEENRFGFEEIAFLLLSGRLPNHEELDDFKKLIFENMPLKQKTILHIMDLEGSDIMNILARSVLEFYTYDDNPDDVSRDNLMRQSIELISKFPTIIAYAYAILRHKKLGSSIHIRYAQSGLSLAENFLYMLKGKNYTKLDARTLDLLLILHSEHGGGNNSTFTVRVTSSQRDTELSIYCIMLQTIMLAPPCFGPFREPRPAAIDEYVSVPVEDVTLTVNVELFPPPCSECSIRSRSRVRASNFV